MVATPIGNWGDISQRALETLRSVTLVAAEDTRYALRLLSNYSIKNKVVSCHQNNELHRAGMIVGCLERGEDVAYVSDSGAPGVSDPGAQLVEVVSSLGFEVVAVPGVSSVTAAISISGLGMGGFHFLGFLPRTNSKQIAEMKAVRGSVRPIVIFESPRRIKTLLENALEALGDRKIVLCRELTKIHEEIFRGTVSEILQALPAEPLGEITLVISGITPDEKDGLDEDVSDVQIIEQAKAEAETLVSEGLSRSDAAAAIMQKFGIKKRVAYQITKSLDAETSAERSVVFTVKGDPGIRATHKKTIEFKRTGGVSERETCVVGAAADWDTIALKKMRGRVTITISSGDVSDSFDAEICARFNSLDRMVIRKSFSSDRATIAVNSTKGSSDISRKLIEKLQDAGSVAQITITKK